MDSPGKKTDVLIKSISYDQGEILRNILRLYVPSGQIDCDPTYSKGNFYSGTGIAPPPLRFDIVPQSPDVVQADARHLPLADTSISCMVLDPPFLATRGPSLAKDGGNIINRRFGVYPDEQSLHHFYVEAMQEAYRILRPDGVLIFKIQDKVSSGKQYFTHCFVYEQAVKIGFYALDCFVLLARNRLVADWQIRNQRSARKYHSYFWVFQKSTKQIHFT